MVINIASFGGRTHMLDTAKELHKFGHTVRFYSYVPTRRAIKYGLNAESNRSYFLLALPFLALRKLTGGSFWSLYLFHRFFDAYLAFIMPKCDVFIGQSPLHVLSLRRAKSKYNAITILERGSSHILTMINILESNPSKKGKTIMPNMFLKRDLEGYELADYISIASHFQKRSFIENGVSSQKLLLNPYGISLEQFYPTSKPGIDSFDLIFVGGWSYRKGCDILIEAVNDLGITLLHVGSVVDIDFPSTANFTHIASVDQAKLVAYYEKAKVFVLPSREDGFGMVLSQAMICGLPIVCSVNTGGPDLASFLDDDRWVIQMDDFSVECLKKCIKKALGVSAGQNDGIRDYLGNSIDQLTWLKYGERYNNNLRLIADINDR